MPGGNIKIIRKRIATVKNTQKITRAMKLVAAARLRRAQENITRMRPYAQQTMKLLSSLAARVGDDEELHPLLARREEKNILLIVLSSDRGLAGGFNASVSKAAFRFFKERSAQGAKVTVAAIGRKGRDFLRRRDVTLKHSFSNIYEGLSYDKANEIGQVVISEYASHAYDACYLIYNEFKSAMTQTVKVEKLLPIEPQQVAENETPIDYIYEPDKRTILETLLPLYVNVEIYRALLESVASEHGARMTAMDNATRNAKDMISRLTLQANRARQAAITTELMEIIGGAEALKG
ncbi:MAG TPA: ATP synthase F1 subunit gamma [Polyangiales bacterium]|nr:ATP synthase F1 subunit gamma [Polyangiales bacterium]